MPQEARSDRYELPEELSHRCMSDVWRGYDGLLDRAVVVNVAGQAAIAPLRDRGVRQTVQARRVRHRASSFPQVSDVELDTWWQ